MNQSPQQRANLRCCASCEWIYVGHRECPKCGFASYGARFVHGDKAYMCKVTQKPWMDRKMDRYRMQLMDEVETANHELSGAPRPLGVSVRNKGDDDGTI